MYALPMTEVTESAEAVPVREWTELELVLRSRVRAVQRQHAWTLEDIARESGADRDTVRHALFNNPVRTLRIGSWSKLYSIVGGQELQRLLIHAVTAEASRQELDTTKLAVAAELGYLSVSRALRQGTGMVIVWNAMLQALKLDPEDILEK